MTCFSPNFQFGVRITISPRVGHKVVSNIIIIIIEIGKISISEAANECD